VPKQTGDPTREAIETFKHVFDHPKHRAYRTENGAPGALLVHGFLGTPDEMRPVADVLLAQGWSVSVPLLPGHGSDLDTLFETDCTTWLDTVRAAYIDLARTHAPLLLVGNSMGAAMATSLASELAPDGLLLFSPFVTLPLPNPFLRILAPVLSHLSLRVRPFRSVDLNHPELRQGIHELVPDLDLDDPQTQRTISDLVVPARVLGRLAELGRQAIAAAPNTTMPVMILQGIQDDVALPRNTRDFLMRLTATVAYQQLPGGHEMTRLSTPSWTLVADHVIRFAASIADQGRS